MSSSAVVAEMAQNGPKWSKIPYNVSKWPKMPQPGPTWANKATITVSEGGWPRDSYLTTPLAKDYTAKKIPKT